MPPKRVYFVPEEMQAQQYVFTFDCTSTLRAGDILAFLDELAPSDDDEGDWDRQVTRMGHFVTGLHAIVDPQSTCKGRAAALRALRDEWECVYGKGMFPSGKRTAWGTWTRTPLRRAYPLHKPGYVYPYRAPSKKRALPEDVSFGELEIQSNRPAKRKRRKTEANEQRPPA